MLDPRFRQLSGAVLAAYYHLYFNRHKPCWLLDSSVLIWALCRLDSDNDDWYPPGLNARFLVAINALFTILSRLRSKILSIAH